MKTTTVCMCECKCPIKVVDPDLITCAPCNDGDHWDQRYEMNWAKSFAVVFLFVMSAILLAWVVQGGIVAQP